MTRMLLATAVFMMAICGSNAFAQSTPPKMNSPGEIAAKSQVTAERRAKCLAEAKVQKLSFTQRRRYVTKCVKELGG